MPGSGKGTVAKLLEKRLGIKHYSVGDVWRAMAKTHGMTLVEFLEYGETHPWIDKQVDRQQALIAKKMKSGVFDGRTSFYFIPNSVKIFFACDLGEGARRIANDPDPKRKNEARFNNLSEAIREQKRRIATDTKRYKMYYDIDIYDRNHYDLIINTTKITPKQTVQKILQYLANSVRGKNQKKGQITGVGQTKSTRLTYNGAKVNPAPPFSSKVVLGKAKKVVVEKVGRQTKVIHIKNSKKRTTNKVQM